MRIKQRKTKSTICELDNNLILGNTRELDRVPVTKYLSYIHLTDSLYYINLVYSKNIYRIILLFQNLLQFLYDM